jgi:hypothetical protein
VAGKVVDKTNADIADDQYHRYEVKGELPISFFDYGLLCID